MPGFNPYLTPQMNSAQESALQQQIGYLQNQLQQVQSARQQQMMAQQQAIQQPQMITPQAQPGIMTQIVESFDAITANAVPMDNNGAIFIKNDGSEIQTRRWTNDGRIQMTSYLPQQAAQNTQTGNLASGSEKPKFDLSDEATGAFMQRFDEISNRLDAIEQLWNNKQQAKNAVKSTKKEVETE